MSATRLAAYAPEVAQPGRRRSRTTTRSRPTPCCARRCSARARAGPRTALVAVGALAGRQAMRELGRLANENPPMLRTHDRFGHRIDEVEYHPAWHELLRAGVEHGLHALPWREPRAGRPRRPRRQVLDVAQVEAGHGCPISMTYSGVPALRTGPGARRRVGAALSPRAYDRDASSRRREGRRPVRHGDDREAGRLGRARQHHARAERAAADGEYELTGHKWFCSAPMCDAFLVLAQADGRPVVLLLPRFRPDGSATPSACSASRTSSATGPTPPARSSSTAPGPGCVGEEGRGVPTIIEMVGPHPAGLRDRRRGRHARRGRAGHLARPPTARAFGKLLADQPLMRNVLADLALESEAATVTAMRLARAYDEATTAEAAFKRIATAVAQVLGVQARVRPRRRGAGVPRRQRLRGGVGHAAAVPRGAAQRRSGRARATSSRSTSCAPWSRRPRRLTAFFAEVEQAAGADARLDAPHRRDQGRVRRARDARAARPPHGREHGAGPAGLAARAPRPARGRRRVLRLAPGWRRWPRVRHPARRRGLRGDHRPPSSPRLRRGAVSRPSCTARPSGCPGCRRWRPRTAG